MVQWFFYQMLNDIFLYNIENCTFWATDTFTDFINGFLLVIEENDPVKGILSFSYSLHKGPITYYSCKRVTDDYSTINAFFTAMSKDIT
jgi:hypothetical protein